MPWRTWVACGLLISPFLYGAQTLAADSTKAVKPPDTDAIQIAHSAQLTIDGTAIGDSLALRIRRVRDQSMVSEGDIAVTVDGKPETATRENDGTYLLPANDLQGTEAHAVDVIVPHDGIREILSGTVAMPQSTVSTLWRDHKQMAWWILNIGIVLVAAIFLSRRKSAGDSPD